MQTFKYNNVFLYFDNMTKTVGEPTLRKKHNLESTVKFVMHYYIRASRLLYYVFCTFLFSWVINYIQAHLSAISLHGREKYLDMYYLENCWEGKIRQAENENDFSL